MNDTSKSIPTEGDRTTLSKEIKSFLAEHSDLHLGGPGNFEDERSHHSRVFGIQALPKSSVHPISEVEFTAIRGPHGTIPMRVFYPRAAPKQKDGNSAALIYFHGGGYTVGSVDESRMVFAC